MFVKYNAILRGLGSTVPYFQDEFHRMCQGNTYPTTLHAINSCLVKLSLLTQKEKVRARPTRAWGTRTRTRMGTRRARVATGHGPRA